MNTNTINQNAMKRLAIGLMDRNIRFTVIPMYGGLQIRCTDWDAICHEGSYGHERGLLEVMGLPDCGEDVLGYLTAEDVLEMVDEMLASDDR